MLQLAVAVKSDEQKKMFVSTDLELSPRATDADKKSGHDKTAIATDILQIQQTAVSILLHLPVLMERKVGIKAQ